MDRSIGPIDLTLNEASQPKKVMGQKKKQKTAKCCSTRTQHARQHSSLEILPSSTTAAPIAGGDILSTQKSWSTKCSQSSPDVPRPRTFLLAGDRRMEWDGMAWVGWNGIDRGRRDHLYRSIQTGSGRYWQPPGRFTHKWGIIRDVIGSD